MTARRASRSVSKKIAKALAILAAAGFGYIAYIYLTLPDVRPLAKENPKTTAFMEIRKAEARRAGQEKFTIRQQWIPYQRISPNLRRAVIVTEDAAFFDHDGIDLDEIKASLEKNWEEGQFLRGGSTITQQLAKNLYLSESRNPMRKFTELLIARRLEAALTKQRIFEIYLNVIEWGDGIFGCEMAARTYFGKSCSNLDVPEAELAKRRAEWKQPETRYERGYGWMFTKHIKQANEGCDFDFLQTDFGAPVGEPEIH